MPPGIRRVVNGVVGGFGVILVTGGNGYIGSALSNSLQNTGLVVKYFHDANTPLTDATFSDQDHFQVDYLNTESVEEAMLEAAASDDCQIEGLVHLGARPFTKDALSKLDEYPRVNIVGTQNLFAAVRQFNPNFIIYASSSAVYAAQDGPLSEDAIIDPITVNGWTKLKGEQSLREYCETSDALGVALRIFNVSGIDPFPHRRHPEWVRPHLVKDAVEAALDPSRPPIVIFRDSNGNTPKRDIVSVADVRDAILTVINLVRKLPGEFEVFNVGSGFAYSTDDVIEAVQNISGNRVNVVEREAPPDHVMTSLADISKLKMTSGWRPSSSKLNEIAKDLYNWARQRKTFAK